MSTISSNKCFLYRKPAMLCRVLSSDENRALDLDDNVFIDMAKSQIETMIANSSFDFRIANDNDLVQLYQFIKAFARPEEIEEVSTYDIFRFVNYGYGLVVHDEQAQIVGCIFEIGYDNAERASYSIRLVVHPDAKGYDLGRLLTYYTCLLAMQRGSRIKKGIIDWDNYISIHILVNKIGWILHDFIVDLPGIGTCYKTMLPLTKEGLLRNRIAPEGVTQFLNEAKMGTDYRLVKTTDIPTIEKLYRTTSFKGVAFLRADRFGLDHNSLLLIPAESMDLEI